MRYCEKCGERIGFFESTVDGMHYRCYQDRLDEMQKEKKEIEKKTY